MRLIEEEKKRKEFIIQKDAFQKQIDDDIAEKERKKVEIRDKI